jgi:hypothetical protein
MCFKNRARTPQLKRRYMGAEVVIGGHDAAAAANAPAPRLARVPMLLPARHLEALVRRALSVRTSWVGTFYPCVRVCVLGI